MRHAGALDAEVVNQVTVDVSKDFWPVKIEESVTLKDLTTKQLVSTPRTEAIVGGFYDGRGWHFPSSVTVKEFTAGYAYEKGSHLPKVDAPEVIRIQEAKVEKVEINRGVTDRDFESQDAAGTSYFDERDGGLYLVDQAGTIKKMAEDMKNAPLPVSVYSKKEASKIMRERQWRDAAELRNGAVASKGGSRLTQTALKFGIVTALCFLCGLLWYRWLGRRGA